MGARKKFLAVGLSVMVHVVALSYLSLWEVPEEPPPASTEITLRHEEPSPPPEPEPPAVTPAPTAPAPTSDQPRPRSRPRRFTPHEGDLPVSTPSPGDEQIPGSAISATGTVEGPPRPPGIPRFNMFPPNTPDEEEEKNGPAIEVEVRPPPQKKKVAPIYGQTDSNKTPGHPEPSHTGGGSMATGGGRVGGGMTFDFWAPPDFNEEMAKANAKLGPALEKANREKTTDLGHGVICNTRGHWFICQEEGIEACNATHEDLCRYAKVTEKMELQRPVIF